jgi:sirohydrochlorin cobaltochelatase
MHAPESLRTFFDDGGAVLVVGHGTRNPVGASQLLNLVAQMQSVTEKSGQFQNTCFQGCFLELAEPSIQQAMEQLANRGVRRIIVVPVLLFTAAHAKEDIPESVASAAELFGIQVVKQTSSLGTHSSVLSLVHERFQEVARLEQGSACPQKACALVKCTRSGCDGSGILQGRIGLAMVGRGTSDESALAQMRKLTSLHADRLQLRHCQTGFFAGGRPSVDELLQEAVSWDCDTVVVQPHLLFEGELVNQLRAKVSLMQCLSPNKNWLMTRTLGADPLLAETLVQIALE